MQGIYSKPLATLSPLLGFSTLVVMPPPPKTPLKPVVVPQRPSTSPQHPHDDDDFGFVNYGIINTYI